MRPLVLTAHSRGRNTRHARIVVFQNGGAAGVLTIDADQEAGTLAAINSHADLVEACKVAAALYDRLSIDTDPLACACKHGPDYMPPTREEWREMCLEIRQILASALAKAEVTHD